MIDEVLKQRVYYLRMRAGVRRGATDHASLLADYIYYSEYSCCYADISREALKCGRCGLRVASKH
jgi:hypothetical protein